MVKILLTDLDGTVRCPISKPDGFITKPEDQRPAFGAVPISEFHYLFNWKVIGITNQGGVAAGYKTIQNCVEEQCLTLEMFPWMSEIYFCPDQGETCGRITRRKPMGASRATPKGYRYWRTAGYKCHWYRNPPQLRLDGFALDESLAHFRKPGPGMLIRAVQETLNPLIQMESECCYNVADRDMHLGNQVFFVGDMETDREAAELANIPFHTLNSVVGLLGEGTEPKVKSLEYSLALFDRNYKM